ncbi:MAG: hypothetical protein WCH34_15045 [Bacteroidota bacterium]
MRKLLFIISAVAFVFMMNACHRSAPKANVIELLQTDKAFSELSVQKGKNHAFLEYIDTLGIMLRPGGMPIMGLDSLRIYQSQHPDTSYTLSWDPLGAKIAQSGDLGFTYGVYTYKTKDTTFKGTYATVWTKTREGKWKMALDVGN